MPADFLDKAPSVDEVLREVSRLKSVVTEAVDEGFKTAMKTVKQGREAAEDAIDDSRRYVKQNPFEALGIIFAVGVLTGAVLTWANGRRR